MSQTEITGTLPLWKALAEEFVGAPLAQHLSPAEDMAATLAAVETEFARQGGTAPAEYAELKEAALAAATQDAFLAAFFPLLAGLPQRRAGLCFSGGGIRSATFGLGVLQGLAQRGLLDRFQYLSTVSGGGYLGGWLSAWMSRHPGGPAGVFAELRATPAGKIDPEPRPVRHLRNYSNYLNPKLGLFSADTWALAATVLRNILLNWLMLLPLFAAALMVPAFCANIPAFDPAEAEIYVALAAGFLLAALSVSYIPCDLPGLGDRRGTQQAFLLRCLAPMVGAAVALTSYWAWSWKLGPYERPWWEFALFGLAIHLAGWLRCLAPVGRGEGRKPWKCPRRKLVSLFGAAAFTGLTGGVLAWWVFTRVLPYPIDNMRLYACLAVPALLGVFSVVGALLVGIASKITEDEDREWWARGGGWMLLAGTVWLCGGLPAIYAPQLRWLFQPEGMSDLALRRIVESMPVLAPVLAAVGTALSGIAAIAAVALGHSGRTAARKEESSGGGMMASASALALAFVAVLVTMGAALATDAFPALLRGVEGLVGPLAALDLLTSRFPGWFVFLTLVGLALVTARFVNVNKFSLHAMYRNRLIRAYLGASHEGRQPNPFTGFDPGDNIAMHKLSAAAPLHVVNMTLNLVSGERLAWQERKAESFTATRLHAGSLRLGYRDARTYGDRADGITLGTAVTISGAAASPNMGYHSSPLVTLLMTLFNARLGWWLGNPGPAGEKTWTLRGPNYAVMPMLEEALGLTNDTNPYVYLSDGGHFENLALYEMVLRRCGLIVAVDAGCDPSYTFGDLGNAVRKIRIDLGVPIEFRDIPRGLKARVQAEHWALATIRYSCVDAKVPDGMLLYVKPALSGDEPADVANYASSDATFPHQSTGDQWFDESQFESYRRLGLHSAESLCGAEEAMAEFGVLAAGAGAD